MKGRTELIILECEDPIAEPIKIITLEDFDNHLDNYRKVMQLQEITLPVFWKQFKMCYNGGQSAFMKTYEYFKANSRHLHNTQLNLCFKG